MTRKEAEAIVRRYKASPWYDTGGSFGARFESIRVRLETKARRRGLSSLEASFHADRVLLRVGKRVPSLRQYQEALKLLNPPKVVVRAMLDEDECAHLADLLAGANHPLSQSILRKVLSALHKLSTAC